MDEFEARVSSNGARNRGPISNVQVSEVQAIRVDRLRASRRVPQEGYRKAQKRESRRDAAASSHPCVHTMRELPQLLPLGIPHNEVRSTGKSQRSAFVLMNHAPNMAFIKLNEARNSTYS
jgi:hypothetical protein